MLSISVMIETHPEFSAQYNEATQRHAKNTLKTEEGCVGFAVNRSPENPARFFLYESYASEEKYEIHKASPHLAEYRKITESWIRSKEIVIWDTVFGEMKK